MENQIPEEIKAQRSGVLSSLESQMTKEFMAVYTFLEHYDFTGKTIHPFCTHEGSGLSHTVQDIQKAAPQARVTKGLAIHGSSVDGAKAALENWIQEVH